MGNPIAEPKKWTVKYALWCSCFFVPPAVVLPIIIYKHYTTGFEPAYSLENIILVIIVSGWVILLYVNGYIKQRQEPSEHDF